MQLFAGILSRAAEEGTQTRLARAKTGQYVTNTKQHSLHAVLDPSYSPATSDSNIDPTSSSQIRKADSTTTTAAAKIFRAARELGIDLGPARLASSTSPPSSPSVSGGAGGVGGASASRDLDLSAVSHLNGKSPDEIEDFRLDLHIALKRREMQEVLSERDVQVLKIWSASVSVSVSASSSASASTSAAQEDAAQEDTSTATTDATVESRGDAKKGTGVDK